MFLLFQDCYSSLWLDIPFFSNNTLQAMVGNQSTLKGIFALMETRGTAMSKVLDINGKVNVITADFSVFIQYKLKN